MKKRNPLAVFFLSIITIGIYDLYWLATTKKELNAKTSHHTPSIWLLIAPLPVILVGYILLFTASGLKAVNNAYGNTTLSTSATNHTVAHPGMVLVSAILLLVGFISAFIISIIWFFRYSKAVNEYTKGKMSTAVSFLVLWLIHLIGVALIQDTYNDVLDGTSVNTQPPQPAPAASPGSLPPNNTQASPMQINTTSQSNQIFPDQQPRQHS